jgi:hypothetical protein
MGGWIGFGMAKYAPERINALLIAEHPYADHKPGCLPTHRRHGLQGRPGTAYSAGTEVPRAGQRLRATGSRRIKAAAFGDVLPAMVMPCQLLVGEQDICPFFDFKVFARTGQPVLSYTHK